MNQSFHRLWVSQMCANFGDVLYIVGLIAILYQEKNSPFLVSLLPVLNMAGYVVSSTLAPLLFNRYKLKAILSFSQLFKTLILGIFCIGLLQKVVLWEILLVIFLLAFLDGFAQPASSAMVPRLVGKQQVVRANGILSMIYQSSQLGGWALGGVFVAVLGNQLVMALTFFLYAIASIALFCLEDTPLVSEQQSHSKRGELTEGFCLIYHHPTLRSIQILSILESVAGVVWISAILYLFVSNNLQTSQSWWGYINAFFFAGLIIGGLFCTKNTVFIEKNFVIVLLVSSLMMAVSTFLFGLNQIPWLALIFSGLVGVFSNLNQILLESYLQKNTAKAQLPKIYSAKAAIQALVFGGSTLIIGYLADFIAVYWLFVGSSIVLVGSFIYLYVVRKRFVTKK